MYIISFIFFCFIFIYKTEIPLTFTFCFVFLNFPINASLFFYKTLNTE